MTLTGKQKAAMLLTSLDVGAATDLLQGFEPDVIQELAVELSYLEAAGHCTPQRNQEVTEEFYEALQEKPKFEITDFLDSVLKGTVGEQKTMQIKKDLQSLLRKKDPLLVARTANTETLANVLETEHPQAVAVVLSELPPKQSSEILGELPEGVRLSTISRMTNINAVPPAAKARIAEMVGEKIGSALASQETGVVRETSEQSIRKVAVVLRNMDTDTRDNVLSAVGDSDPEKADSVRAMMVIWEDVASVADRSLQQALRGVDEQKLAVALHEADQAIVDKIKGNISERAASMVDEEASLMTAPKKNDVRDARETIVGLLRNVNSKGELVFDS